MSYFIAYKLAALCILVAIEFIKGFRRGVSGDPDQ